MDKYKIATIILAVIVVLQFSVIAWAYSAGTEYIEQESECAINICADDIYNAYYYDEYAEVCYCYTDNEIVYEQYIG